MPRYVFENTETGDQFELEMSYDELKSYLTDNPNHQQIFKMNIADSVIIGVTKPPADFSKHVLGRVKEMPGADKSKIEKRWTIPREV